MATHKIYNKGKAQIFQNKYLEFFTKGHPLVIFGMYIPLIVYMLYYSYARLHYSVVNILLIYLGAVFFWTLFEYIAHRFIFHAISERPLLKRVAFVLHGNHHIYPRDRQRLFMPPLPSILIAGFLFGVFYLVARDAAFIFFPGFISGYLVYGSMHYAIHAWAPPFKWLKPLWKNHHLHHYKDEEKGFGVSSVLWDKVFGTMFGNKEKENPEELKKIKFD